MKYQIIYADPPWEYNDKCHAGQRGVSYKYNTIPVTDVQTLPVAQVANDDALLFLWCPWPQMPEAFKVMEAWGFIYKTIGFLWVKMNKVKPTLFWGMGNWTRSNSEPCLLGIRGKPKRASAAVHSVIVDQIGRHSAKPPIVRDKIVELVGDVPRIELFAREKAQGWDAIGNEVDGLDIRESLERQAKKAWSW